MLRTADNKVIDISTPSKFFDIYGVGEKAKARLYTFVHLVKLYEANIDNITMLLL
jgi:hypothetical protein